jgi:hypothetical protein
MGATHLHSLAGLGLAGLGAATVLLGFACTHDFDQYNFDGAGGTGPTTTTTTTGGFGGAGGVGGLGTGGVECVGPFECMGIDTDCSQRICNNGQCGTLNSAEDSPCNDNGCTNDLLGMCVCSNNGACVECNDNAQCSSGVCAFGNVCATPECTDTIVNGDETDVDCGGTTCPGCADGLMCIVGGDCASGNCDNGTCAPCVLDADCAAVVDTWCDAGVCSPLKIDGDACAGDNECLNGNCPADDGVCCDTACGSLCESCLAVDTGGADGTCAPVSAGTDPKMECTLNAVACSGDNCGGVAGACEPASNVTVCRVAAGGCDAAESCDGVTLGCPADMKQALGFVCNPSLGLCDPAETCDGVGDACPADMLLPIGASCRPAADVCDAPETCTGGPACPADAKLSGNVCNPSAGPCDGPETCNGVSDTCPADQLLPDGTPSLGGVCNPYLCDGAQAACPASCVGNPDCLAPATCQTMQCL